jgi:hypothetical protein
MALWVAVAAPDQSLKVIMPPPYDPEVVTVDM